MKILYIFSLIVASTLCSAEEATLAAKDEVEHLFTRLNSSDCQFSRNGSWYSASEAAAHLRKKYDFLLKKKMLTTAESFIEKAATQSSLSGRAYEVKCKGQPVVVSSIWFNNELLEYRKAKGH